VDRWRTNLQDLKARRSKSGQSKGRAVISSVLGSIDDLAEVAVLSPEAVLKEGSHSKELGPSIPQKKAGR
jgi:hypothetical protein